MYKSYLLSLTYLPGILSIFYGDELGMQGLGNLANRRPMPWNHEADFDILNTVRKMGNIRNTEIFLEKADLEIIDINKDNMSFIRRNDNEEAYVMVSRVNDKKGILVPKEYRDLEIQHSLNHSNKEELTEYGGIVLKKVK